MFADYHIYYYEAAGEQLGVPITVIVTVTKLVGTNDCICIP